MNFFEPIDQPIQEAASAALHRRPDGERRMTSLRIEGYDLDLDEIEAAIAEYRSIVVGRAERLGIDLQKAIALGVCMFLTGYLEDDDRYNTLSCDEADALIARMAQAISRILEPGSGDSRVHHEAPIDDARHRVTEPG